MVLASAIAMEHARRRHSLPIGQAFDAPTDPAGVFALQDAPRSHCGGTKSSCYVRRMNMHDSLSHLAGDRLLSELADLVRKGNELTAELLAYLAEVERRELHLEAGFSSMFAYCTQALGLAESSPYKRIAAARSASKYPSILAMVASGALHLAGLCEVSRHLTDDNHEELLQACCGKSKREIEKLIATGFPQPSVPDVVRKLPPRRTSPAPASSPGLETGSAAGAFEAAAKEASAAAPSSEPPSAGRT